jgi:prepilin-type N-terminal cleavage/methylation domain-containing protein
MTRTRRGVTLIELAVVIVVIGIIAAIALPRFLRVRERAYLSAIESDLRSFATQQELYHDRHQEYAGSLSLLQDFMPTSGVTISITAAQAEGWAATGGHSGLASRQCGLYYGTATAASAPPATQPGVIACN